MRSWLLNTALFFFTCFLLFFLLEVGVRVVDFSTEESLEDLPAPNSLAEGQDATLGGLLQVSRFRKLHYELKPNLRVRFLNEEFTTNSMGFRDEEYREDKGSNVVRIAGIGDSLMMGWGVADGKDYLSLLENRLNLEHRQMRWEIINSAVPGYNTTLEVETLKKKLIQYSPDLVLVGFVESNDFELPHFVRKPTNYLALNRLFFVDFLQSRLNQFKTLDSLYRPSAEIQRDFAAKRGVAEVRDAFLELRDLGRRNGFEVVVYAHEIVSETVAALCRESGFELIQAWPGIHKELGDNQYRGSKFTLSEQDPHPSSFGHEIAAEILYKALLARYF